MKRIQYRMIQIEVQKSTLVVSDLQSRLETSERHSRGRRRSRSLAIEGLTRPANTRMMCVNAALPMRGCGSRPMGPGQPGTRPGAVIHCRVNGNHLRAISHPVETSTHMHVPVHWVSSPAFCACLASCDRNISLVYQTNQAPTNESRNRSRNRL